MTKKRRRQTSEQIIRKLAEGHRQLAGGMDLAEACRRFEIAESTRHRQMARRGGTRANDEKGLKELEGEIARFKRLLAEGRVRHIRC